MFDNNKQVASSIISLTGQFITSETVKTTWNRSNPNYSIKTARNSSVVQEETNISKKIKSTKRIFDFVKGDTKKAINKAKNIRNDTLKKVNQAEEILEAAKEDLETKVIIAAKKFKQLESAPEKKYLRKQTEQAIQDAEKAKKNFDNKKSEVTKKRLQLQQYEEKLEAVTQMQKTRIKVAKMACKRAQMEQEKTIQHREYLVPLY